MLALQVDIIVLIALLTALVVVRLFGVDSKVENPNDCRPSSVHRGDWLCRYDSQIRDCSVDYHRGGSRVNTLLGLASRCFLG